MNSVQQSKVRAVPSTYDILNACAWRLTGITSARYQLEMKAVGVWLEVCGELEDIHEDLPTLAPVLEVIRRRGDRRSSWGQFVALLTMNYVKRRDWAQFYRVGNEVLHMYGQASKASSRRRGSDGLNVLIRTMVTEFPEMPTQQVADELGALAGNRTYKALVDFDLDSQTLTYQPSSAHESLRDIGRIALVRRIERIRKAVTPP